MSAEEAAGLVTALQSELVGTKAKVISLEETIANLAQENMLLKRRLYGNKTERSHTSEAQLALGDLLAAESQLRKELDAAVAQAKKDAGAEPNQPGAPGERAKPKGRRDLFASSLPRSLVEILDEELEAKGCRRIGFEESKQLMFRRGGFWVLVKRLAKYEVIEDGSPTVVTVPSPQTLFPRALLHTSTVAHLMMSKFGLGVPHYRLERDLADRLPLRRSSDAGARSSPPVSRPRRCPWAARVRGRRTRCCFATREERAGDTFNQRLLRSGAHPEPLPGRRNLDEIRVDGISA